MDFKEFEQNVKGKGIDDFAKMVKELPIIEPYFSALREGGKDKARDLLQVICLVQSLTDKEFLGVMTHVSQELLFSLLDEKFKNEILSEKENG